MALVIVLDDDGGIEAIQSTQDVKIQVVDKRDFTIARVKVDDVVSAEDLETYVREYAREFSQFKAGASSEFIRNARN